jgi:cysteine-rich repeat protein
VDLSDELPDACRTDCRLSRCGDLVVDSGEACDDGNDVPGDGCDRCQGSICPDGSVAIAGVCPLHSAAPACVGADCATDPPRASRRPVFLLLLSFLELDAAILLWLRIRTHVQGVQFVRDGKGDVFLQSR